MLFVCLGGFRCGVAEKGFFKNYPCSRFFVENLNLHGRPVLSFAKMLCRRSCGDDSVHPPRNARRDRGVPAESL